MVVASVRSEPAFGLMVVSLIIIFGPLVAQKLRLPGLIGLLIGGALIGPNMLGVLETTAGLEAFGDVGVLYLIFLAGLSLDMKTLRRHRSATISFGLITATIPWALGTAVALAQGYEGKTAVLIGSFWASFTLVSYSVIPRYGLTRNPSMAATVGASSITDTIGLVTLALIIGSETSDSSPVVLILKIIGGLVLVAVYCIAVLPRVTRWFFAGMGQERELRYVMVLAGFTSAAVVADAVGIEPLIGAFFAGIGLNPLIPNRSRLMARTDFFGNALFIPAFLVSVGLLVDPSVMFAGDTLRLALGLSAALIVGKGAASWVTGRIYRYSKPEVGLMFGLSAAQAAATLASTIVGFDAGLYGDEVVNGVMIVIVISLLVSAIGANHFAPLVEPAVTDEQRLGEAIVVPIHSTVTLDHTLWLAGQIATPDGGVVLPLWVAATDDPTAISQGKESVATVRSDLRSLGLTGDAELRVDRSVAGGVDRFTLERNASLVLLTWPGPRDMRSLLLGGTNDEIVAATQTPFAVAALRHHEFTRVVLAIDARDLDPGAVADVVMGVAMAQSVAAGRRLELAFGPLEGAQLADAGLALPDTSTHLPGPDGVEAWVDQHGRSSDLVFVASQGDPFVLTERLATRELSTVVVANHQDSQWFSTDGALGITAQRR